MINVYWLDHMERSFGVFLMFRCVQDSVNISAQGEVCFLHSCSDDMSISVVDFQNTQVSFVYKWGVYFRPSVSIHLLIATGP